MHLIRLLILLSLLPLVNSCQQESCTFNYPEFITQNGLEEIYDSAKLDWYLLNATDSYSNSDYLIVYDSIVDADTRIRDATDSYWGTDHQLLENKQEMRARFGADRIREFINTDIVLFLYDEESMLVNDTLTLTFFPEDNEKGQLVDPIDGAIHTLIYVNGRLTTVGQNDYVEFDVDAEEVAQQRLILREKVQDSEQVTNWLRCKVLQF